MLKEVVNKWVSFQMFRGQTVHWRFELMNQRADDKVSEEGKHQPERFFTIYDIILESGADILYLTS